MNALSHWEPYLRKEGVDEQRLSKDGPCEWLHRAGEVDSLTVSCHVKHVNHVEMYTIKDKFA